MRGREGVGAFLIGMLGLTDTLAAAPSHESMVRMYDLFPCYYHIITKFGRY